MSDTGGGHRASANALVEALQAAAWRRRALPGGRSVHQLWRRGRSAARPTITSRWWIVSSGCGAPCGGIGEQDLLWRAVTQAAQVWQAAGLQRFAADYPADLYVSVHPLLNHVPRRALSRCQPQARFATVVTDLASAPRVWYDPGRGPADGLLPGRATGGASGLACQPAAYSSRACPSACSSARPGAIPSRREPRWGWRSGPRCCCWAAARASAG